MRKRNLFLVLALAVVMVFALVGCKKADTPDGGDKGTGGVVKGGTMSFYIGEPAYLDPYNAQESEGMQVTQVLFDSLTDYDWAEEKIVGNVAESWEANEDASVWTFKLKQDSVFSDGTPVTANDFIYAWNRMVDPNAKNTLTGEADPSVVAYHLGDVKGFAEVQEGKATEMSGLKALDDYTLEVTLSGSFADFPFVVMHPALSPVPKAAVEGGVDYNGEKVPYGDMPIGNGPFKMAEPWAHDQYVKVVRNDAYTGTQPNIDGIDFRIFKDVETAYTEFEAGNLDFTQVGEGKIEAAKATYGESADGFVVNPGGQVLLGEQASTYYLILNNEVEILKDANVRKAINLAINRQAICDIVFEGSRAPADNIIPPGLTGYEEGAWADSRYDIEAAKAALADAGYADGKGLPTIKLSFNSGGGHEKIMELIQADLSAIGIKTEFDSADFPVYLQQLDEGKHELARLGWLADYPTGYNFLYSILQSKSGDNKSFYKNADVDAGLAEAQTIIDDTERSAKLAEISALAGADNPVAPIMFYRHKHIGSERLNDFYYSPMGFGDFTNVWITPSN